MASSSIVINDENMMEDGYDLDLMHITERFIESLSYETKVKDALKRYTASLHKRVMETRGLEK